MASPNDRQYTETHEWHKVEGNSVTIGLTRFAVDELTDITFVDIIKQSGSVAKGEVFGEIESVKATSEIYSGIDGEVTAINQDAIDHPEIINEDPFERGWLVKIEASNPGQVQNLMSAALYDEKNSA